MDDSKVWALHHIKAEITALNKQVKNLETKRFDLEEALMNELSDAGLSLARTNREDENGKRITVAVNEEVVATVNDWAEFEEYIYTNRALYLLHRRPANVAYREEVAAKGNIRGVESFTKQKLSLKHV